MIVRTAIRDDCLTVFAATSYIALIPAVCFGMAG